MTEQELQAIEERVENATEGPWGFDKGKKERMDRRPAVIEVFIPEHNEWFINGDISNLADAEFIAHAREDVPALIAEVERLQQALTEERKVQDWYAYEAKLLQERHDREYIQLNEVIANIKRVCEQSENSDTRYIQRILDELEGGKQ